MKEIVDLSEKEITLDRNDFLKVGGSIDTNVYYIASGAVKIFILDGAEEQIIRFGYKGNLVTVLDSFLTGLPSALHIQALKKSVVRIITRKQIDDFLDVAGNRTRWVSILEHLVLQQMHREVDLLTTSPKERYQRVLERSPQLFQEIPHKHIANYLRMSAETLSRQKKSRFRSRKV